MRGSRGLELLNGYTDSHDELHETSGTVLLSSSWVCPLTGGSVLDILWDTWNKHVLVQQSIQKQHRCEVTHLHVVPVTEDLSGSPLGVAAGLGHIVGNNIWLTLAVHFQFQADIKYLIILQTEHFTVSKCTISTTSFCCSDNWIINPGRLLCCPHSRPAERCRFWCCPRGLTPCCTHTEQLNRGSAQCSWCHLWWKKQIWAGPSPAPACYIYC